jgi:hypothetical protein
MSEREKEREREREREEREDTCVAVMLALGPFQNAAWCVNITSSHFQISPDCFLSRTIPCILNEKHMNNDPFKI